MYSQTQRNSVLIERVNIISNREVAHNIWEMYFKAPELISEYKGPGQFINILVEDSWNHPLRRPMSIASAKNGKVSIIYKTFGDVTKILSKKEPNDNMEILGPLGNTFTNWNIDCYPILVGGGVGIPPLLNLKSECEHNSINHSIIIGARNSNEHFMTHQPEKNIILTTDDGSFGEAGTVMNPIDRIVKEKNKPYIFACGPEPMLIAIRDYALINGIPAQLSVESYMGCGVGFCQGCVISKNTKSHKDNSYHEQYSLVCLDGPIYEAEDIKFEQS